MIVADRKNDSRNPRHGPEARPRAAGRLRHLRHRVPGRRRARGGHPRLRAAHVAEAGRPRRRGGRRMHHRAAVRRRLHRRAGPARRRSTTPSARWAAGRACRPWPSGSPRCPSIPGLNTQFMGILESQGVWTEKCSGCGNCRLGEFAGICPITRCAKRLLERPLRRLARRQVRSQPEIWSAPGN